MEMSKTKDYLINNRNHEFDEEQRMYIKLMEYEEQQWDEFEKTMIPNKLRKKK